MSTSSTSRSNKGSRGGNFTRDEIDSLLDSVEEVMPIGMDEWALVERRHMASYPDRNRTKESLRRKFQLLYLSKQPTGRPECPPEVRRAKSLQYAIREKAEVSSAGSESEPSPSAENDEAEGQEGQELGDEDDSPASIQNNNNNTNNNLVETTESESTNQQNRPPAQRLFSTPVTRVGRKRRKRSDDDDEDISIKDLMRFTMVQQQQDRMKQEQDRVKQEQDRLQQQQDREEHRHMMMQMMSVAVMSIVGNNSRNFSNEHFAQMMASFAPRPQRSANEAINERAPTPAPAPTAMDPPSVLPSTTTTAATAIAPTTTPASTGTESASTPTNALDDVDDIFVGNME
mmetsp:Transcript_52916/g.154177  ORF Transcript_52916/g.154177 Transcript_52916/m.154177 type:complete len:344 (-) Transcript_52916:27-1058(-)